MTSKVAALEYLRQQYPQWILGGLMNSVWVEKNGDRVTTGFRGSRNCRALVREGKLERREDERGFVYYRYKQ